jgi:voltage-gated potassium channel
MKRETMKRMNFAYLLGGLLILILVVAIAQEEGIMVETRQFFLVPALCLLLLMGVWSLVREKKMLIMGSIIAGIGVALATIDLFLDMHGLQLVNMGIILVFCLASTWIACQSLFLSDEIDLNKIIGAICIYLLLGLNWSIFYVLINMAIPDSFHGLTATDIGNQLPELLYYSFVTITTLGYGDLTPVKPLARTFAYLEAIVGQFYVAVLVAWLVGMYLSEKNQHRHKP